MPQPDDRPRDYESAMGGMTLDSASSTETRGQNIKDMEKNREVKTEETESIRSEVGSELSK